MHCCRILCTGEYIFSSSYDKTAKAWLFDTTDIEEGCETEACVKTFKGHKKGIYPLIFIPLERDDIIGDGSPTVTLAGGILITGSADCTAKSWSFDAEICLKACSVK